MSDIDDDDASNIEIQTDEDDVMLMILNYYLIMRMI